MNRLFGSTTARIATAFLFAQLLTVGLALLVMHGFTQRVLTNEAQNFVAELQQDLSDQYRQGGLRAASAAIAERIGPKGRRDSVVALRTPDGNVVAGNLDEWPASLSNRESWRLISLYRSGSANVELIGLTTSALPGGYQLLAGEVMEDETRLRQTSETAFVAALLLGMILASLGAWLFARFIGTRIASIADTTEKVGNGELSHRVALDETGDAFDRLAHGINAMLERIEGLVGELRLVTDSLAHDLRSPVSRLKATVERAITSTRDTVALEALGTVSEEADRLQNMLTTALQISRAEAGLGRDQFREFEAGALIADMVEVYGPLAEDRGFEINFVDEVIVTVSAHRELLGQAIANLIDNALKYAVGGNRITLHLEASDDLVTIAVADNGPGIPADQRGQALRRFGRLDAARQAGGAGLGLSLVSTVAHLHGGQLVLEDATPGLRAVLSLPIGLEK